MEQGARELLQQSTSLPPPSQQQQQLNLLFRVLQARQRLLHPHNLLLGQTHHQLAVAAAGAAGMAPFDPHEPLQFDPWESSSSGRGCSAGLPQAMQRACALGGVAPSELLQLLQRAANHAQARR